MALNDEDRLRLELAIEGAKDNFDELSEWEQAFMVSTEERHKEYGDGTRMSDKQWAVIDRIYEKVGPR